ncbi:MAG: Co2+/Mg2+ efflux protein ApaG [Bacteroidota bacterium]
MITQVTQGIQITVRTFYQDNYSRPGDNHFLFTYRITIENKSDYTVQLLRRHWFIYDSNGEHREVEGEGVVGQQPILMPGDIYEYESACNLNSDMGKMKGTYLMERQVDKLRFYVSIPEFEMVVPSRLN